MQSLAIAGRERHQHADPPRPIGFLRARRAAM